MTGHGMMMPESQPDLLYLKVPYEVGNIKGYSNVIALKCFKMYF